MTGWHLKVGYSPVHKADDVWEKMQDVATRICAHPEAIAAEVFRVTRECSNDDIFEVCELYRQGIVRALRCDDTIQVVGEGDDRQIMQLCSNGTGRSAKEAVRRAFCRLFIAQMHAFNMDVTLVVA